jgi:CO/xanthine dehydrogenase Mo-binding subunit
MPKKQSTKVSLQSEFYSDLTMDNMLYGVIVRSPAKSGIITSISHGDLPDGYFLFTARDVPGNNLVDTPLGKVPVFSEGNISYKGEPLGILVGPDENKLFELLSEIEIVFDSNTIESYLKSFEEEYKRPILQMPIANQVKANTAEIDAITKAMNLEASPFSPDSIVREHEQAEKEKSSIQAQIESENEMFSVVLARRSIEKGPCFEKNENGIVPGLNSVFNSASYVVEGSWSDAMHTPSYTEPNGAICFFSGDYLTIYTPTQWLSHLRKTVAQALHIDPSKILIKKTNSTNRTTNSIWYNSIIACQVATAAFRTGSSIKLVYSREEQELYMERTLPITIAQKMAVDDKGKLIAMQVNIDVDAGSSNPFAQEILDRLVIASYGCYNPVNISVTATAYRSPNPSSSLDLQLIDTAAFFSVENQLNELCILNGMTPAEIRKANIAQCSNEKCLAPFQFTLERSNEVLDALIQQSDFNRKFASYHLDSVLRATHENTTELAFTYEAPLRGIGLSCGFEGSGYYGSGVYMTAQTMEVTLEQDQSITIHTPPASDSIREIWIQTASHILGVPQTAIHFNSEFDAREEPPLPESIYSNISVMTSLLTKCCESIMRRTAETTLPLTVKKTITPAQKKLWNADTFNGTPFHSTSFAAGCVELELDPCTFREHIRGIWVVVNGGQILSLPAAERTIKLCIQKVLSSLVQDETVNGNKIHISFLQSTSTPTQIGELVYQVLPSAYTQALTQAVGCTINTLPLRTDSLYNQLCMKREHDEAIVRALNSRKKDSRDFDLGSSDELQKEKGDDK